MSDELRIKIILDDGSVKEGFVSAEKQAEKSAKKIGKSFDEKGSGLQSLADGAEAAAGGIGSMAQAAIRAAGPVGALIAGVAAVAAAGFKMALAGEQVNAVNTQFINIATSAGLAADQFGQSIINATQGLIDDEDALQIATKGIVALGDQASKLPAILDASRSVSRALGKDFKATFEDLSSFVENGNARVLRQFGIVLDLDKAYEKAAKSIGLTASALTEQQKQQVRANLILDEVPKKFSSAAESVTPLKDAFDRLKVSASNSLEAIQSGFANFITKKFVDEADLSNVATSRLRDNLSEVSKEISSISSRIEEIKLDKLGSKSVQASAEIASLNTALKKLREEQQKLFLEQSARSDQELFSALDASRNQDKSGGINTPLTKEQIKIIQDRQKEVTSFIASEEIKRLNFQNQIQQVSSDSLKFKELKDTNTTAENNDLRLQNMMIIDQKIKDQKLILQNQELIETQTFEQTKAAIEKQFSEDKLFTVQQRNAAIEAAEKTHQENLELIRAQSSAKEDGLNETRRQKALEFTKTLQQVGVEARKSIGLAFANSITAAVNAFARGEDGLDAFLKSALGGIADLAIQYGSLFLIQAAGFEVIPGLEPSGAALAASGVGLLALGGVLKALSGGASQTSESSAGGGIASSPSLSTDLTQPQDLKRAEATTGVSVVIQGDVLDSDESGSRIVSLINQAFDKKGVVINQGVMA